MSVSSFTPIVGVLIVSFLVPTLGRCSVSFFIFTSISPGRSMTSLPSSVRLQPARSPIAHNATVAMIRIGASPRRSCRMQSTLRTRRELYPPPASNRSGKDLALQTAHAAQLIHLPDLAPEDEDHRGVVRPDDDDDDRRECARIKRPWIERAHVAAEDPACRLEHEAREERRDPCAAPAHASHREILVQREEHPRDEEECYPAANPVFDPANDVVAQA